MAVEHGLKIVEHGPAAVKHCLETVEHGPEAVKHFLEAEQEKCNYNSSTKKKQSLDFPSNLSYFLTIFYLDLANII